MSISLEEVRENDLLPNYIVDMVPDKCECGADIVFSDSLKQVYCPNEDCYIKIANRMYKMIQKLDIKNIDSNSCKNICRKYKITSPYQLFLLDQVIDEKDKEYKIIKNILDNADKNRQLWEVVELSCIPDIENVAKKLFYGYNSLGDAFDDIEYDKASFIAEKLGIKSSETSVLAVKIYNKLIQYKDELLFGETQFEIAKLADKSIYIAIDGYIDGFKNKSEFIDYLSRIINYKINVLLTNTVSNQIDVLVADKDISSNKVKAAIKINNDYVENAVQAGRISYDELGKFRGKSDFHPVGEVIAILSSKELIERLQEMMDNG